MSRKPLWKRLLAPYLVVMLALAAGIILITSRAIERFKDIDIPRQDETREQLEARVRHAISQTNAPLADWRYIVIHHSATATGNAAKFDAYHREKKKWANGLAYHFVIGNGTDSGDGQIEPGPRWTDQAAGAHCGNAHYNTRGIGICLVGNLEEAQPSEQQMRSLMELCRQLCAACKIPPENVIGHREVPGANTKCPGRNFDLVAFRTALARALAEPAPKAAAGK